MNTIQDWVQFAIYGSVNIVICSLVAKGKTHRCSGSILFAFAYGIFYIISNMLMRMGLLGIVLAVEIIAIAPRAAVFYWMDKKFDSFFVYSAYSIMWNMLRSIWGMIASLLFGSAAYIQKLNYSGNAVFNTLSCGMLAFVCVYILVSMKVFERVPVIIWKIFYSFIFTLDLVALLASIYMENEWYATLLLNVDVIVMVVIFLTLVCQEEIQKDRKKRMILTKKIQSEYQYYASLGEEKEMLRRLCHDLNNYHTLSKDDSQEEAEYQRKMAAAYKRYMDRVRNSLTKEAAGGAVSLLEQKKRRGEKYLWFCYGGLLLGMVAGNYPLYRYVYSLPDYYRYLFGYNCLACMLIAVLLVIRMKGEKKEERRLQEMVRERERQYEEWNSMIIGEGLSQKLPADNFFDTMLQSKCQICERYQISLKCEWKIPREMNVEDADKTGLIGNLMDNAIEACIRQTEGEKVIRLNTYRQANFWIIRVDNSKHDKPLKPGLKTEKKEKQDHGMGMEIIENIVEKYDGAMKIHEDGKWFSIIVMLRIK